MKQRLHPSQRIRKSHQYQQIIRSGLCLKGRWIRIWIETEEQAAGPSLGIIASRRADPRATGRNLWKRRLREIFRRRQNEILAGKRIVVQALPETKAPDYAALETELMALLKKGNALS